MINYIKGIAPLALIIATIASSCTEAKTNTQEQTEIIKMDSTAASVKESTNKLEDQTKKVEASLEKLDNEFKTNN
jgi:septal ring factor EnvC (AmiA/AmiB activator)